MTGRWFNRRPVVDPGPPMLQLCDDRTRQIVVQVALRAPGGAPEG
jgi:hypothetical protein